MPLISEVKHIENYEQNFPYSAFNDKGEPTQYHPVTHYLVLACIAVPIDWKLTEKNVEAFIDRFMEYQTIFGPIGQKKNDVGFASLNISICNNGILGNGRRTRQIKR